jgi:adenine-specific DNA-methyltransferase
VKIEQGKIVITGRDEQTGVVNIEYASDDTRVIKTVWHRSYHDAGAYGSDMITDILGQSRAFSFPKSIYSTKDAISAILRNNRKALVVDFFAGSGTTLHAVNLMNAEDGGNRRCILVTNNEVSEADARELKTEGYKPGDLEWESHGICQSVTWPRTQNSILGKLSDGAPLSGEYYSSQTAEKEIKRSFHQLGFIDAPAALSTAAKKQVVALIGKDKLPQSLVKSDSRFIVSDKYMASVLFDPEALDEWLTALDDQDQITDFYIVAKDSRTFNAAKAKVEELLGTITITEPLKRPMGEGFPANVEYFRLGFLDKDAVSLGQQFKEILPLLWLKSGARGARPEITDEEPEMLILPDNGFAVLVDETKYAEFHEQIARTANISTIYYVTNSDAAFREMSEGTTGIETYQLYRSYIENFVLGSRRA